MPWVIPTRRSIIYKTLHITIVPKNNAMTILLYVGRYVIVVGSFSLLFITIGFSKKPCSGNVTNIFVCKHLMYLFLEF